MKKFRWLLRGLLYLLAFLAVIIVTSIATFLLTGNSFSSPGPTIPETADPIEASLLKEDLAFLIKNLEEVHPNLYSSIPRESVAEEQKKIESQLNAPLSAVEFYKIAAPLVAKLEDGHTGINTPTNTFNEFRKSGGSAFPYRVQFLENDGLRVVRSYSGDQGLAVGDRIISINGHSADSLFTHFREGFSGKRLAFRNNNTARYFTSLLWLHDIQPPYDIHYESSSLSSEKQELISGVTRAEILRQDSLRTEQGSRNVPYSYKLLSENIGYIDFRSMVNSGRFSSFLEETFSQIKQDAPQGLIVDLRNNGGGNSFLGNQLLEYLTDQPYVMSGGKSWKMSAQYKKVMARQAPTWLRWVTAPPAVWLVQAAVPDAGILTVADGEIVDLPGSPNQPQSKSLRYSGSVCFLIGSGTFSSAMMLANAVEDNDLAYLIGEESGGIPNHYGELYFFQLPNSKLRIFVSSAQYVRANGDADDKNGVLPDQEVYQTETDTQNGMDTVLEAAKEWVLNKGS